MFLFFPTLLFANPDQGGENLIPASLPTEDTPTEDTPTEDTPTEDTPTEDTPTEDTPTEDTPTEDTPTEDTPTEDTPTEDTPTEDTPTEDTTTEDKTKESSIEQALSEEGTSKETLEQLLLLFNEHTPLEERSALLKTLHTVPGVISSLQTFALHAPKELRIQIIELLLSHPDDPITYTIARKTLKAQPSTDLYESTFALLADLSNDKAASILKTEMENTNQSIEIRRRMQEILEQRYPEWYEQNPSQQSITDFSSRAAFSLGGSILGASLFSSLGQLGQGEDGASLGIGTGVIVGSVGGALYTQEQSISLGSALYFTHATTWGTMIGNSFGEALDLDDNGHSIFRALGSLGGAAYGIQTLNKNRTVRDVIEANIIHAESLWMAQSLWETMELDNYDESFLVGALAGFGLSELITPTWHPNGETLLLAGIYGFEGAFLGNEIYEYTNGGHSALPSLLFHSGLVIAGLHDHYADITPNTIGMTAYGAYTGHMLGQGFGKIQNEESQSIQTSVGGLIGTALGSILSNKTPGLTPSYLLGSSILVQANTFLPTSIINTVNGESTFVTGVGQFATGLGNIGMGYFQDQLNLTGEKSLFLTSTSFWGTYLTVSTIALLDVEPSELGTSIVLLSSFDAGLGAGVYLLNRPDFEIRSSINPQLFAIIGGSLGSFGAFLINDSTQSLALGSLIGVGIGGYMGTKYKINLPSPKFFDDFFISAAPQYTPQGDLGVQINIAGLLGTP